MSKKTQRQRMRSRWNECPNCFWCGTETVWIDEGPNEIRGERPDNMATLDHIRSRLSPNRKHRIQGNWQHGIWVLSCNRCNSERAKHEVQFYKAIDPDGFYDRGNARPAPPGLLQLQSKLCSALLNFIRNGGILNGDCSRIQSVMHFARTLQAAYDSKHETALSE